MQDAHVTKSLILLANSGQPDQMLHYGVSGQIMHHLPMSY